MTTDKGTATSNNPLEQFVLLAKSAKGAAAVELIKQVLEAPGVHVFGELLDMPNVIELENGPHAPYYRALHLFAYGTYRQYLENKAQLLDLTPMQKKKLQHLTIVTLATKSKCIPYSVLLQELDMKNVRDLEDLIIEAIYADIIHGKLDLKNSQLEVDYAIGRDTQPADLGSIISTLQEWCDSCETVLSCVEMQITRANSEKNRRLKHKEAIEQEFRRLLGTFCLQCPSRVQREDIVAYTVDGPDDRQLEYNVLKQHLCSNLDEDDVDDPLCETGPERMLPPFSAEDFRLQGRPVFEPPVVDGQVVGTFGDALLIKTVACVHAEPERRQDELPAGLRSKPWFPEPRDPCKSRKKRRILIIRGPKPSAAPLLNHDAVQMEDLK